MSKDKKQSRSKTPVVSIEKDLDDIVQYNLANNTHFYKKEQVEEHKKKMQQLKQMQDIYDNTSPFDIGEDVRDAYISAGNRPSSIKDVERLEQFDKDAKKTNIIGLQAAASLPMLGEFTTYGLLGGGLRLGSGFAGSKAGEYVLGKTGDYADSKLGTNFFGTTGRIVGGLGGFIPGMKAATGLLRNTGNALKSAKQSMIDNGILGFNGRLIQKEIPYNPNNFYRRVTFDAIKDANESGLIRGNKYNNSGPYFGYQRGNPTPDNVKTAVIEGTPNSAERWVDSWRARSRRQFIKDNAENNYLERKLFGPLKSDTIGSSSETSLPAESFWTELMETPIKDIREPIVEKPLSLQYLDAAKSNNQGWLMEFGTEAFPMTNGKFEAPASNFKYWKKHPIIGWRQHKFTYKEPIMSSSKGLTEAEKLGIGTTPKVKYYGPTMGKTTAVKENPALVDFDDIVREPSKQILKKFGFNSKSEMYNSENQEAIRMYEDMLLDKMREFKVNPQNSGKTLVVSPTALANPETIGFHYDNVPSLPSREVFIQRNVGRGGTPEASALWYDSILKKNPNIKIDNRFVSQIEYASPTVKQLQVELESPIMNTKRILSDAERLGIPKGERSNPQALEDPQYWGYQQWNDRYNAAIESGNWGEAQRLRDLHFKIKAPDTKVVDENGMPLHMYHGTDKYFTIFKNVNPTNIELRTGGYHTKDYNLAKNAYARGWRKSSITGKPFIKTDANVYDDYLNITDPFIDTPNSSIQNLVHDLTGEWESNWGHLHGKGRSLLRVEGHDGVYVPKYYNTYLPTNSASQIKSAEPITWNGNGEIIPIVKRDNFHNPDIRYKQGGIVKAQNGIGRIPVIGPALKRIAYRIITNPEVQYQGGATNKNIMDALLNKSESLKDDNKEYFLFGVDRPETTLGNAYDWSKDIKENKYKRVKPYQGILNPYNEYIFNKRDAGLVKELAKHKYNAGLNINMEYSDPITERIDPGTPIFDDVHDYQIVFHNDENGNPVISASDLYDFGENYSEGFKDIFEERSGEKAENKLEWQRKWLNRVGQPYLLVQKNIPIRFTDNPTGNEINRVNGITSMVLDRMPAEKIAEVTDSGLIPESRIIAYRNK